MNNAVAIVIAGALIAAALFAHLMVDRYRAAGSFTVDGMPGLWRLNERNGSVAPCLLVRDPQPPTNDTIVQYYVQCRN